MNELQIIAEEILAISKNIFTINVQKKPQAIFKGKTFLIDGDEVSVEENDSQDSFYYFENDQIDGVIIKDENGFYSIKATIQYINTEGEARGFAKIRIYESCDEVYLKGRRTGSWEMPDFDDDDFLEKSDNELPIVLNAIKNSLTTIDNELNEDIESAQSKHISKMVKQLIKYNL